MDESDWIVEPVPTQLREIRVAARSKRILAAILNRICWNEMRGVEALSVATRYFSSYPKAALSFARHNADEARHVALFANRALELGGLITPYPGRADVLKLMPGFKSELQGNQAVMVGFLSRGYVEEYRGMLFFEAMAGSLDHDPITQRVFQRIALDERRHISYMREVLEWLSAQGQAESIPAALDRCKQSTAVVI